MSRKIKTLAAALVVLVLLGGGYAGTMIYKERKAAAGQSSYTPSPRLGNLEGPKLVKIEIPDLTLEKKGENWELVSVAGGPPPEGIALDQIQVTSRTSSLASIWVERTVEEAPADISQYGLDAPSFRAAVTDSDGKRVVYNVGNMDPSMASYYMMEEGDPKVYAIASYIVENMRLTVDILRQKYLFPAFELADVTRFLTETPGSRLDITKKTAIVPAHLAAGISSYIVNAPYRLPRGADSTEFNNLVVPLSNLSVINYIDAAPSSLEPYGLENPIRLLLETAKGSVDLLVGDVTGEARFAKLADDPEVFTVSGLDAAFSVNPFSLIDKFALLVNIDNVDRMTVSGGPEPLSAGFEGKGDEGVYSLNGRKTVTDTFKKFYESVIGLLMDAEYPGPARNPAPAAEAEITVTYELNTPPGVTTSITLVPYNRDYYALAQEGVTEFLIARSQVNAIFKAADAVTYEE